MIRKLPHLYLLTDPILFQKRPMEDIIEEALHAGVRFIQYRAKEIAPRTAYRDASVLRELTRRYDALLVINDHVDLALAVDADGVHLGQEDLPPEVARQLVGGNRLIGISTHGLAEAVAAAEIGADYIGLGPVFCSSTKESGREPIGLQGIRQVREKVRVPIYAIGGVTFEQLRPLLASGASGVAAISALAGETGKKADKWLRELSDASTASIA